MTARELVEVRRMIDAELRQRLRKRIRIERELEGYADTDCPSGWANPETGYRKGCRCRWCTVGTTDARQARRNRTAA